MDLELRYYPQNANDSVKEIEKLPYLHQVAFCASVCERSILIYKDFTKEERLSTFPIARKTLDEIWLTVTEKSINIAHLNRLRINCEKIVPQWEASSYAYEIEAIRSVDIICCLLGYMCSRKRKFLKDFVQCLDNIIPNFLVYEIARLEDEQSDKLEFKEIDKAQNRTTVSEEISIIADSTVMRREMTKENEDLQLLKKNPILTPEFVQKFRDSALSCTNGKSIIDV